MVLAVALLGYQLIYYIDVIKFLITSTHLRVPTKKKRRREEKQKEEEKKQSKKQGQQMTMIENKEIDLLRMKKIYP